MHRLALRWGLWFSLLTVFGLTGCGAVRYLAPPDKYVPIESLRQYSRSHSNDDPAVARIAPEEVAAWARFRVQWPTSLPSDAVFRDHGAPGGRVTFLWSRAGLWQDSVMMRLDQDTALRQLPDRSGVTVHGLPGRAGQVNCLDRSTITGAAVGRDCIGIWWIEDGVSIALTSPVLSAGELLEVAESLRPVELANPVTYTTRIARQVGGRRVSAGKVTEYPTPSVTYLSNLQAYLVRTAAGFTALADNVPHRNLRVVWRVERQRFESVTCGRIYSWLGGCIQGSCFYGLERFNVTIDGDNIVIDTRASFLEVNRPYDFFHMVYGGRVWP